MAYSLAAREPICPLAYCDINLSVTHSVTYLSFTLHYHVVASLYFSRLTPVNGGVQWSNYEGAWPP